MKNRILISTLLVCSLVLALYLMFIPHSPKPMKKIPSTSSPKAPIESRKARMEYFWKMLRDPATGKIPENIRERELSYAKTLPKSDQILCKGSLHQSYTWKNSGPLDVGGRTRALAVDVSNDQTIIAGGVSGGIWKSTDNGLTWSLKSSPNQQLSVTALAQDPRSGHTNVWYYGAGEFAGNSASDRSYGAYFYGAGLYKSTDNGNTWQAVVNAGSTIKWDSYFDFVIRIAISPVTGTVFVATNGGYIFTSRDGFNTWNASIGGANEHYWTDVAVTSTGKIIAVLSQDGYYPRKDSNHTYTKDPGVYISEDDGITWTDITPASFPEKHQRSVIACAPSNPNIFYVFTNTGQELSGGEDDVRLHKFDLSSGTSTDLSANLPAFESDQDIDTQGNYNMVIAVKPDNENFVVIGATNLYRSTDGFSTPLNEYQTSAKISWIGGYFYGDDYFMYPNLHPDQHVIAFSPSNPNTMWVGHDGGLSYTSDITITNYDKVFPWINKNNSYITTQFYTVAIPRASGNYHVMGGTQDNGSPSFTFITNPAPTSHDLSSGDGSYCYFGTNYYYSSYQEGGIIRANYNAYGDPNSAYEMPPGTEWSTITPIGAEGQLFINPFAVDPNNEDIMFYPADSSMWRNNALSSIPNWESDGTDVGWTELTNLAAPSGYYFTAMAFSIISPKHRLYYAASSNNYPPKLYRLDNAETATSGAVDISIPAAPSGAYIHNIAVNPDNGNEILVVMSNYNIVGLYHSTDGGATFTSVEGNLTGNDVNPGPSLRSATILPQSSGSPIYFVGTSTGLYSTRTLNGAYTVWTLEGSSEIGNTVVEAVTSRNTDGRVAIGTHGRGVFIADIGGTPVEGRDNPMIPDQPYLSQNYPNPFNPVTTISFSLPKREHVELTITNINGRLVKTLVNGTQQAGKHTVKFDGSDMASGVYLYTLKTEGKIITKRLTLVK